MKFRFAVCMVVFALSAATVTAARIIAFERDGGVWLANLDGSNARKVADGNFPSVSPDGTRVAFNTQEKQGDRYLRRIAVLDVLSDKISTFTDVPSENSYYPAWSPDGKQIVFSLRDRDVWNLGLINADGSGFRFLKRGAANEVTLFAPCWARDGQSVFCQNMTDIFQLRLDGAVGAQWKIDRIIPNGSMTGDERIDVSPGGTRLLLSVAMEEEHDRANWDGPVPALWSFEIATQKAARLTSKKVFAWEGRWIDDENVLFLSQNPRETEASIYRMSAKGDAVKLLIKDARMPSVSVR